MTSKSEDEDEHTDQEKADAEETAEQVVGAVGDTSASEAKVEEEPIEGGDITGLDEPLSFNQARHEANTARTLSYLLVAVLAGYFVLHYAATFAAAMWLDPEAQETFQNVYNAGLPVLSGLAGSAATYFFTRRNA